MISGAQIRAARGLLGWTQETLCSAADVSARTLRSIEAEEVRSSLRTLQKLRDALENAGVAFSATDRGEGVFLERRGTRHEVARVKIA